MAITFTQTAVDRAVTYLMTGGPNGGELTAGQYQAMTYLGHIRSSELCWRYSLRFRMVFTVGNSSESFRYI